MQFLMVFSSGQGIGETPGQKQATQRDSLTRRYYYRYFQTFYFEGDLLRLPYATSALSVAELNLGVAPFALQQRKCSTLLLYRYRFRAEHRRR